MLAHPPRSLPPMLHNPRLMPIPRYSKGPGVFSSFALNEHLSPVPYSLPSPWSRQWEVVTPSVQVGTYPTRNFCYLRMVIVTTAVYRGLNSPFRRKLTDPLNLPGTGQASRAYTAACAFARSCVLVNSRYPWLCATPRRSSPQGSPLMPKARGNLPSSLTRDLLIALVFSPDHQCRFGVRAATRPDAEALITTDHGF